ncbi:probable L-type lectin-domain containing receptor kinase S.5 [Aristolochia californica]|uniref:probable L-type lectin-domain containing receptor kinase S.5 n=1 Tax=Aristolochia californica TaxID=171875 RepID=UPI0035E13416
MIFLDQSQNSLFVFCILQAISLLIVATSQVSGLHVSYSPYFNLSHLPNFNFYGSSNLIPSFTASSSTAAVLQITPDSIKNPLVNRSGRAMYKETFKLWRNNRSVVASFQTKFELMFKQVNGSAAEGMAFILTNTPELPANSYGQWLGITNEKENGSSKIVAIEFDTHKSNDDDVDDNHVGVDVNGMVSVIQVSLSRYSVNLSSDANKFVDIQYNGTGRQLTVYVQMNESRFNHGKKVPVVSSWPIDLSEYLEEDVYVGFSGSTGNLVELNYVMSWTFTGDDTSKEGNNLQLLWILLGILLPMFIVGCSFVFYLLWNRKKTKEVTSRRPSLELQMVLENSTRGPRKFRFKELRCATKNFSPNNKLGRGGFGTVYKGYLKETNELVAIKKISEESRQGQREFVEEVTTIGRLSHKNLVKLIGWCYERNELLLVYEFMPNGSLDKLLFKEDSSVERMTLSWETRVNIIHGVASVLYYLHEGCHGRILHRDVKASNVMLDSEYNARLGDFGLARTIQSDDLTHHTTDVIAGTPGYVAPEYCMTGRATAETDIYGFGVFVLEVACGRKPKRRRLGVIHNDLLDWVWHRHELQRDVDAADPRLQGVFDKGQMECVLGLGLSCCHLNPKERPSMRLLLQVLNGEAAPLVLPLKKPSLVWPPLDAGFDGGTFNFEISADEDEITEFMSAVEITVEDPITRTQIEFIR